MELHTQAVMALAPDASSAAAGRKNSATKLWKSLGRNESAIWGECQGSAIYQVKVDLRQMAFNCSCPSRKLPCKHVLGLLLIACESPGALAGNQVREWVASWLDKRDAAAKKKEEKANTAALTAQSKQTEGDPTDAAEKSEEKSAAKAKRASKRDSAVAAGIEQLDLFLSDLVRQGFAGLERKALGFWEQPAKRLVDAQAKGLANRVRRLGEIPASGADWPSRLLAEVSRLQLLSHAAKRIQQLSPDLASEVRQQLGYTVSTEELATAGHPVEDDWLVIGQVNDVEDRLRSQKTWLWGRNSAALGYHLQFAHGTLPFSENFLIGNRFRASAVFYPGTSRSRMSLGQKLPIATPASIPTGMTLEQMHDHAAERLAIQPWLDEIAIILSSVQIIPHEFDDWQCVDADGSAVKLRGGPYWNCLAETGGEPATLFAAWDFSRLRLISLLKTDEVIDLTARFES